MRANGPAFVASRFEGKGISLQSMVISSKSRDGLRAVYTHGSQDGIHQVELVAESNEDCGSEVAIDNRKDMFSKGGRFNCVAQSFT